MRRPAKRVLALAASALLLLGLEGLAQTEPTGNVSVSNLPPLRGTLKINGQTYANLQPVSSQIPGLDAATNITDTNGIDEVYVKDAQGRLYIAYGYYTNLDSTLKRGFRGSVGESIVEVVHVNNELNTGSEGFLTGLDDLKDLFKPLVTEHFGKLLTGVGLGSVAIIGRQLLLHPIAGGTLAAAIQAALPVLATTAMRATMWGAIAAAAWPVLKALWNFGKKLYLERQKDNPHTISMVVAETASQLENPATIGADQRREATTREITNEVIRRADLPAGSGTTNPGPEVPGSRGTGTQTGTQRGTGTPVTAPGAPRLGAFGVTGQDEFYGELRRAN